MTDPRRDTYRDRVFSALSAYSRNRRRPGDPIPERAADVRQLMEEIQAGDGIELPPERWRDRVLTLADHAMRRGAESNAVHRIAEAFLERTDRRFDALRRNLWAYAYGRRKSPPLYTLGIHDDLGDVALELLRLTTEHGGAR